MKQFAANVRRCAPEAITVIAGLLVLACAATWPLAAHIRSALPNDLGDPLLNSWILAWDASRLPHLLRDVWSAPFFFPYPHSLAYSETLFGIALFSAPIQWATGNPIFVSNVVFIGSFVLAGAGMYLLARELTGRRDAAIIAGLIFAFTPYRFAHIAHLQMLMWGWLPISMWGLHRYWKTAAFRYLVIAGAAYVVLSLSNAYLMYFAVLPLLALGCAGLLGRCQPLGRTAVHVALILALMLSALGPVIVMYYRARQENGLIRPAEEIARYSAAVEDYGRAHTNVRVWRRAGGDSGEHELFPGAVALVCAVVALGALWRQPDVRLYSVIAVTAFVLSLGPSPTAWGHRLPFTGPYRWLLNVLPGLDGIRAVARLNAVVILAVAILAAFGAGAVLSRVRADRRWLLAAVLGTMVMIEGWAAPIRIAAFDPRGDVVDRRAYAYLAQQPPGAVLELPLALSDPVRELTYQYMTLIHHHPVMNGHSGYPTPLLAFLGGGHTPLAELDKAGAVLQLLRGLRVRFVMVHTDDADDREDPSAVIAAFAADREQVVAAHRFERSVLFELTPPDAQLLRPQEPLLVAGLRQVGASSIRASASQASDRLRFLFDGDPDSRWLSSGPQSGNEWIELALDAPRDIRRLRLQTAERSFGDYARDLSIDLVEEGRTRTVFQGSVLAQFARGLVADGQYPFMEFELPPNHAESVRLRQTGVTRTFFWSIHELQLWER